MRGTLILLLLFTLSLGTYAQSGGEIALTFACNTTGSIRVSADDKIKSLLWECDKNNNGNIVTNVSRGTENVFVLSGCPLNKPVRIISYNTTISPTAQVAVGSNVDNVRYVICNGKSVNVTAVINGHLGFPAATQIPLDAGLEMKVLNSDGSDLTTDVDIQKSYKLKITCPDNVFILVESCDAAANDAFTDNVVSLYAKRTPNTVYDVLKTFPSNTSSETTSDMNGFRLLGASVIHLRCIVDICQQSDCPSITTTTTTSTPNPPPTSGKMRRRRNVSMTDRRVALTTSFRVKRLNAASGTNGIHSASNLSAVFAMVVVSRYLSLI